jgi:hypothetical protein
MNKLANLLILSILSLSFSSCTKSVEKPAVTIGHFAKQSMQINEVVNKLMAEENIKTMNFMADGVEATRAIGCDAVGEECNAYYEFLNKVVHVTKDGELSPVDRALLEKLREKIRIEISKSELKIQAEWKNYINAEKKE